MGICGYLFSILKVGYELWSEFKDAFREVRAIKIAS